MNKNSDKFKYLFLYSLKKYGSLIIILLGVFIFPKIALMAGVNPEELIELTNSERTKNNLSPLSINISLTEAAYKKGEDIIKHQIFEHNFNDKKFSDWIKEVDYEYLMVGENLAIDFSSTSGIFKAWLESDSHKKNILNKDFSEIGIAVLKGNFDNNETILVVQIFGSPANLKTPLSFDDEEANLRQKEIIGQLSLDQQTKYINDLKISDDLYKKVFLKPISKEQFSDNKKFFSMNTFFIQHDNKLKIIEKNLPAIFLIIISFFYFNYLGKRIKI